MRAPQIWMIGDRRVLCIETLRRCIEQMKALTRDARDDFRGSAAPGKGFTHAEQTPRASDGRQQGIGVERFNRAQIDNFNFETFACELVCPRERFWYHPAL